MGNGKPAWKSHSVIEPLRRKSRYRFTFSRITYVHTYEKNRIAVGSLSALCLPLRYVFISVQYGNVIPYCAVVIVSARISRGSIHFGIFCLGRLQTNNTPSSSRSVQPWSSTHSVTALQNPSIQGAFAPPVPLHTPPKSDSTTKCLISM